MKKLLALLLVTLMCLPLFVSCGNMIIVAEKESAGEEVAKTDEYFKDMEYSAVDSQSKALMEVKSGTADGCVVDYVCSIGMIGEGTDFEDLSVVEGLAFNDEQYGIAFRKGSTAVAARVNAAIKALIADGSLLNVAKKYKLEKQIIVADDAEATYDAQATDADWEYIAAKGEMIIGITIFAPMNYFDENNNLTGFETEFAKLVCDKLGLTPKFQEISWGAKETELKSKNIDCIWNGMTINDERKTNMQISAPYMANKQVLVVKSGNESNFPVK